MDFSSCIAKRTRSREALFYRTEFGRRKNSNGGGTVGLSECSGRKSEDSNGDEDRVRGSTKLGFKKRKGTKDASKDPDSVVSVDGSKEDEVVEVIDGEEAFDSLSSDGSDLKWRRRSKSGFEKGRNVVCSDDDGEGEKEGGFDSLSSEGFDLKRRSVSKSWLEKDKNVVSIDVDESESSGQETDEEDFKLNNEANFCIARRTRSKLGFQKEFQTVNSSVYIDYDESKSESSSSHDDTDKSRCSTSVEECTSYNGDGNGEDSDDTKAVKRKSFNGDEKDKSAETKLKRKIFSGLKILVSSKGDKDSRCAAQRTRSHFGSGSSEKKLGTVSRPFCLDSSSASDRDADAAAAAVAAAAAAAAAADDDDIHSDDEDNADENSSNHDNDNGDDGVEKEVGGKEEGELSKPTKRKRVRAPKGDSLFKLFVNTIWEKGEVLQQDFILSDNEAVEQEKTPPVAETSLPLKFSFGVKESRPEEKSDYEKELDQLWAEFDFVLKSSEIGSVGSFAVDTEDANEPEVETDPSTLCGQGKHQLILDEQIGIRCRFCSFVKLEIKYIFPPMTSASRQERSSKKTSVSEANFSMFDGLHFQDTDGDSKGSYVHTEGTVWDKIPGIRKRMYAHQKEGFEFLWKNIAGSIDLDKMKKSASSDGLGGCVISHAPGTGKTFLTLVFLQTYMDVFPECRPVIIAPCSMLLTWEEEFKKWKVEIPFHNLNNPDFSGNEDRLARELVQDRTRSKKWNRMVKLVSWSKEKSILGVSYPLFEKLAGERSVKDKEGKRPRILPDKEGEEIKKILLEKPSLLVLDEGHTPRNDRSLIWKVLKNIKTERRIILSGTPFQNNFDELYNTLWLVRPKFADGISIKSQKICQGRMRVPEMKEAREKWASLTSSIRKSADDRLEELRATIDPFVHVHRGSVLNENLPGLRDCVVVLHPPPLQKHLLEGIQGIQNPLKLEHTLSLTSVHPSLLTRCCLSGEEKSIVDEIALNRLRLNPNEGVKTRFLMELIRLSEAVNEKVLVFSQFIDPLFLIKDLLQSLFNWTEGKEILQMDGKLNVKHRQTSINLFNDPASKVRVLLASIKACREGINLIGASRVVLLDVVWNPAVERQAISRAYRLGQKKVVYTYHLITSGTMEGEKYCRQVEKHHLSKLVFSSTHRHCDKQNDSMKVSEDKILEVMVGHDKLKDMFEKIIYQPKESNLVKTFGSVALKQTPNGNSVG